MCPRVVIVPKADSIVDAPLLWVRGKMTVTRPEASGYICAMPRSLDWSGSLDSLVLLPLGPDFCSPQTGWSYAAGAAWPESCAVLSLICILCSGKGLYGAGLWSVLAYVMCSGKALCREHSGKCMGVAWVHEGMKD